jgi:hypothetical protein
MHLRKKTAFTLVLSDGGAPTYGSEVEPDNRRVARSNLAQGAKFFSNLLQLIKPFSRLGR